MKSLKLATLILLLLNISIGACCQSANEIERIAVCKIVEQYAGAFIDGWGCLFSKGSTVVTNKDAIKDEYIFSGKINYRSGNCGSVNADFKIEFKMVDGDIYLSKLCVQMPYCFLGNTLRYDNECRQYYQKVENFLSTKPTTTKTIRSASEVDSNIPQTNSVKNCTYALIVGNEDYSTYQTGLDKESDVDCAINDAKIFAEYCTKTFGIPDRQVKVLTNATAAQIKQGIAWLKELASIEKGKAELIFYYSGHGLPHDVTREPYLIPVDVSAGHLEMAIPLSDIYQSINQYPVKRNIVILDACFSGGSRKAPLIAAKKVKVIPKASAARGNTVVLSSSSNEEASAVYSEKQHGYFTYFLLKKIQETKGNVTLGELFDYVQINVLKETAIMGSKQTPTVSAGNDIAESWQNWNIN